MRECQTVLLESNVRMNVGAPNFVPSYHKMSVEEYRNMSFVPTKANLEKRRLEQEEAALQDQQQSKRIVGNTARSATDHNAGERKSMSDFEKDPPSTTTSNSPRERVNSHLNYRPEVKRLSGNFNAPTHVELERHNETKSPRGFRGTIKGWMKKSPPPTIA